MFNREKPILLFLALCGSIALVAWLVMRPSDEKRIRKQFDRVAELFSKSESETMLTSAVRARSIGAMVMPKTAVEARELGMRKTVDPEEVSQLAACFRAQLHTILIKFSQLTISIRTDGSAEVVGNVTLSGSAAEERSFEASLAKDSETDEWRFSSVKLHRMN